MKKIFLVVLAVIISIGMMSCTDSQGAKSGDTKIEGSLEDIMQEIYDGFDPDFPETEISKIDDENIEYFLGTKDVEFEEAIASEPLISPHAHSIALIRVSEDADIEQIKKDIKENVDGMKWICVGVEDDNILVDNIGDLIILIMDENSEDIHTSFLSLKK